MDESAKTTAELSNLAASRHAPSYQAATGQPLTHYHSFFSELLSWRNPRTPPTLYAEGRVPVLTLRRCFDHRLCDHRLHHLLG